ncbi:CAP domain-containing protein [Yoonia sp. MH D7]
MKYLLALFSLGWLAACGGTSIGSMAYEPPVTSPRDQSFGNILNKVRIGNGANAVTYDSRLDAAAQGHADDMVKRDYFNHISPEGGDVEDRIIAQGYTPRAWGENLSGGQQSEADTLRAWQDSPAHDAMLNAQSLEDFGLGVSGTGRDTRWVLVMATED